MKAILLVRVSTESQSYDAQLDELKQFALAQGYASESLMPIAVKESGIKLKEEERLGLNEMKRCIATGEYDAVFVWEISRLARTKKVLFSVMDYLVGAKVQLFIKNPNIKLLKGDGSVDEGAEMVFTLFAQLAEAEMRNKKDRFKRGKDEKKASGHYIGGYVGFGYKVEDKQIVVNEEEAYVIRKAFNLYEQGYSIKGVVKELEKMGYKLLFTTFSKLLVNRSLTGELVDGKRYPQIITKEQFERCREIASQNNRNADKTRNLYFAKNIFRCADCGSSMIAVSSSVNVYECSEARITKEAYKLQYTGTDKEQCGNRGAISINIIDSLLWHVAKYAEAGTMFKVDESRARELEAKAKELEQYISVCDTRIEEVNDKLDRAMSLYVEGLMKKEKFNGIKVKMQEQIAVIRNEQNGYRSELETITSMLQYQAQQIAMSRKFGNYSRYLEELNKIEDENVMFDLIHKHIKLAVMEDGFVTYKFASGEKQVKMKLITIQKMNGTISEYVYIARDGKGGKTILTKRYDAENKPYYDLLIYTYLERFKRKR